MDAPSIAETLPEAYRRVLDRIADLETAGHRREADLVRCDAIAAYARRWNDRATRRLDRLTARAERVLDGRERPRHRYPSRRLAVAWWLERAPVHLRRRVAGLARLSRRDDARPGGMTSERPAA